MDDVKITEDITIPGAELEIVASRAGGPGGQHVNKTSSRITVRWNVLATHIFTEEQKARVLQRLQSRLTGEGELLIHASTSRSQHENRAIALDRLAHEVHQALKVIKKRKPTKISRSAAEKRLSYKAQRSSIKRLRGGISRED